MRKLSLKDERWTPTELFDSWNAIFQFTVDVAANERNTKCERFYDQSSNGLLQSWSGEVVWCNPPYSNLELWVRKAHEETNAIVCMLIPANRTEQKFWHDYVEPYRDNGGRLTCHFIEKRIKFIHPEEGEMGSPMFGCVMLVWDKEEQMEQEEQLGFDGVQDLLKVNAQPLIQQNLIKSCKHIEVGIVQNDDNELQATEFTYCPKCGEKL